MIEQLGLVGTILDEEQSPDEPDSESEQEVCWLAELQMSPFVLGLSTTCWLTSASHLKNRCTWKCIMLGHVFYF